MLHIEIIPQVENKHVQVFINGNTVISGKLVRSATTNPPDGNPFTAAGKDLRSHVVMVCNIDETVLIDGNPER